MSQDVEELKQQLMDVQSQLAFQEDAIGSLDRALASQQQEIMLLRRQLELLRQRQREQPAEHLPLAPVDEKPPHY